MTVSLPSREVFVVDIPTVTDTAAVFTYVFFKNDESVTENVTPVPLTQTVLQSSSAAQSAVLFSKIPRYVKVTWNIPRDFSAHYAVEAGYGAQVQNEYGNSLLRDNYDKIMSADHFSELDFVSLCLVESNLNDKYYSLLSGSAESLLLGSGANSNSSQSMISRQLTSVLNSDFGQFDSRTLTSAFNNRYLHHGAVMLNGLGKQQSQNFLDPQPMNVQVNALLLNDVLNRAYNDPDCQYATDVSSILAVSEQLRDAAMNRQSSPTSDSEYDLFAPHVLEVLGPNTNHAARIALVGYVIDKFEIGENGTMLNPQNLVLDNPVGLSYVDTSVRYGATYCYSVRPVFLFEIPAIDQVTNQALSVRLLISGKHETRSYVECIETVHPPAPVGLDFTWSYGENKMTVHWQFPVNSQRDIKKFQLFRRSSLKEPFSLLVEYVFDDSQVAYEDGESPYHSRVMNVNSPISNYVDTDFNKQSSYVYTVCSIDAHGLTSNYGEQFQVSFDTNKNVLVKKLVSHTGAPKSYPNMYLESSLYENTMVFQGKSSKAMTLYANPQYDTLNFQDPTTKDATQKRVLSTLQTGGFYLLNVLNVDLMKSSTVTITLDDKR